MDELTKHILAELEEQKEHPERFQVVILCDKCGRKKIDNFPKADVEKCVKKYGTNVIHRPDCEKCSPEEYREDEDE